jgi:hypothetical protein
MVRRKEFKFLKERWLKTGRVEIDVWWVRSRPINRLARRVSKRSVKDMEVGRDGNFQRTARQYVDF